MQQTGDPLPRREPTEQATGFVVLDLELLAWVLTALRAMR
jgi:hypothetical protein